MFGSPSSNGSRGAAAWPAAPHGLLLSDDDRGFNKKGEGWLAGPGPRHLPACTAPPQLPHTNRPCHATHPPLLAATAKWAAADRYLSAATCVAGAALLLLSTLFLFSLTEREGQLLGLVLMASGAAGYLGGRRKSSAAVQLQLVACLVGVLLGFGLINEVRSVSGKGASNRGTFASVCAYHASCMHF